MSFERLPATSRDGKDQQRLSFFQWAALGLLSLVHLLRMVGVAIAVIAERLARGGRISTLPDMAGKPDPETGETLKPLLFFYSQVAWDEVWQRPQEFSLRLAKQFDVVFFGPLQLHRRFGRSAGMPPMRQRISSGGEEVLVITPGTLPGTYKSPFIHRINQRLLRWEAELACGRRPSVVATNSPFPTWIFSDFDPKLRTFDLIDDFAAFDWAPDDAHQRQERLLDEADLLLSGTSHLAREYSMEGKPCEYIASGVDFERWLAGSEESEAGSANALAEMKRPIIGYCGSISSRLDPDLLNTIGEEYPEATLLLIGPAYGEVTSQLKAPNIMLLGKLPPAELPPLVSSFDVALIPFVVNEATRALNPIKLMEYLAAGTPVVTVPLPDIVEEFSEVVELAEAVEFPAAIRRVLDWSPEEISARREAGRAVVMERTWAAQGDRFTVALQSALHSKLESALSPDASAEQPTSQAVPNPASASA